MIPPYLADTRVAKLTFFPEGGNLIEGIPAKVALQGVERERYIWYKSFFAKQLSYYHN